MRAESRWDREEAASEICLESHAGIASAVYPLKLLIYVIQLYFKL